MLTVYRSTIEKICWDSIETDEPLMGIKNPLPTQGDDSGEDSEFDPDKDASDTPIGSDAAAR
jgi:hypothetical protein